MPHQHDDNCGHEAHEHDHDHDASDLGPQDNLFPVIDRSNVVALNASGDGPEIIKPWHQRLDEEVVCFDLKAEFYSHLPNFFEWKVTYVGRG